MNWLYIFLGFCLLIMLHEAGHYVAAKATGMRVEKFFLFMGPKIWSFKRGETEYGVASIPIGGYVRITGMNPEEEMPPEVAHRAYYRQPVWKRIVVIGAGPAVNIVLAFLILFVVAFNVPVADNTVGHVSAGTPAARAHLKPGERIVSVDGRSYAGLGVEDRLRRFSDAISAHKCPGQQTQGCLAATPVELGISGPNGTRTVKIFPAYDESHKPARMRIGIEYGSTYAASNLSGAVNYAADKMWMVTSGTYHVFSHIFESSQRKQISGIVGTSDVANQVIDVGITPALLLLALVSLSLGLINLLPILPLDGGHIFWSIVEKLRGRPVSLQVMERASMIGIALVAVLFFIGLSNDIGRLTGEGFNVR